MRRRSSLIKAAAILGLVLGVLAPSTSAGAQDPGASVSFTPASVPVHGMITVTASCPYRGPGASASISISFAGQVPAVEAYGFPLLEDGDIVVDLPLRNGAPGNFDVVLLCTTLSGSPRATARAAGLTLTEPALPRAELPALDAPRRIAHDDPLPVAGSCPATDPPADRVLFRTTVRGGEGVRDPDHVYADLDPQGQVHLDLDVPYPDNPNEHVTSMWCLAGDRFLNRASLDAPFRVEPAPTTATTTAAPSSTTSAVTTTAVPGTATGAVPVAGSPAYTG